MGIAKGFGFVSFDSFEAADAAIEAMNGQYLANKCISVAYAMKKDGKGEKHGSATERLLAAQAKKNVTPAKTQAPQYQNLPQTLAPVSSAYLTSLGMGNAGIPQQDVYGQDAYGQEAFGNQDHDSYYQ